MQSIYITRRHLFTLLILILSYTSYGQFDSFSISANSDEIGMCNFEFYKYSTRDSSLQIFTWDGDTLKPYPIPDKIRTYRGRITNHPNYKAFAVWYPDNTLFIFALKGKGRKNDGFNIKNIPIADYEVTPLNLPVVNAPQKSNRVLSSGYSCTYTDFIELAGGDYETLIAMWENGVNIMDNFTTRDLGLSLTTNLLIIPTDASINSASKIINPEKYLTQITPVRTFWKTTGGGGGAGRKLFCIKPFKGGRTSFNKTAFGAMPHELGHTLELGHYHNQKDSQSGNQYYFGRNSVAIASAHLDSPGNACLENPNPDYTDPVHPWVAEDYDITNKNQFIDIDVLANDVDYNGEQVNIKNFDTVSLHGGIITLQGNKLRYTPAQDFIGRDYFNYTAESGQGLGYFTNTSRVIVEVRDSCYLALHYSFDETSGIVVHDSGWGINSQNAKLINADFSNISVPGIVGNAIDLSDTTSGIVLNDILDPIDKDLSVSVWFKLHSIPTQKGIIFDSGSRGALHAEGLSISVDADGIFFDAQPEAYDNLGAELQDTSDIIVDKWYHAVMVIDRTDNIMRAYIDGREITYSKNDNVDFDPNHIIKGYPEFVDTLHPNKTRIATALGISSASKIIHQVLPLNGVIDEFEIYTKSLSAYEVASLYNSPGIPLPNNCDSVSSTKNIDFDDWITVYPNPSTGLVHIENISSEKIDDVKVYTPVGKIVAHYTIHSKADYNNLDMRNLSKGVYFLKIKMSNSIHLIKKIILQ